MSNRDDKNDEPCPVEEMDFSEFDDAELFRKWEDEESAPPAGMEPSPDIDEFDEAVFLPSDQFDDSAWFRRWDEPEHDFEQLDESVFLPSSEFDDTEWFARSEEMDAGMEFDIQEVDNSVLLPKSEFDDSELFKDWAKMDHLTMLIERKEVLSSLPLSQKEALIALISRMAPRQLLQLRGVLVDFGSLSDCDVATRMLFQELELILGTFASYYFYAVGEVVRFLIQSRRLPAYHE